MFRLWGLAPGRYRVCATPRSVLSRVALPHDSRFVRTCHLASTSESGAADHHAIELHRDLPSLDGRSLRCSTHPLASGVRALIDAGVNPRATGVRTFEPGDSCHSLRHSLCKFNRVRCRRPTRLKTFSYKGKHCYFITCSTAERRKRFEEPEIVNLVAQQILRTCREREFEILAYAFMDDHVHLLIRAPPLIPISDRR